MAKHALTHKHKLKRISGLIAAIAVSLSGLIPVQANGGVDVTNQSGSFQSTFVNILSASRTSNVIAFNTVDPHYFNDGDVVNTSSISPAGFELINAVVTVVDNDTFTVASSGVDESGTVTGDSIVIKTAKRFAITSIVGDGTDVTVTTSTPHGLTSGARFSIDGSTSDGDSFEVSFGTIVVQTAPSATTFTFASSRVGVGSGGAVLVNLIGENFTVNDTLYFQAVFLDGGTPINAAVRMVAQADLEGRSGTAGQMESVQEPQAGSGENNFLNSNIDFVNGDADSYSELDISFFTGTPGAPVSVTLENLYASVYDIDSSQYAEFSDFTSYFLSTSTELDVIAQGSVATRFKDSTNSSKSDPESKTDHRVTVLFDSVSSFSYRIGKDRTGLSPNTSSAFFQLDLSPGWDVGGAWSAVQAPAVISPLLAKTVTFDSNGGTGSMSSQSAGTASALTSNSFTRSGFTFAGWNTAADGSGDAYADTSSFPFTASTTLYAQWTATGPAPATPYTGPLPIRLDISCLAAGSTGTATLIGERLNTITGATVDGKAITLSAVTVNSIKLGLPSLTAGIYDILYASTSGSITHQSSLTVCASPSPAPGEAIVTEGQAKPFLIAKRFSNYRGDRGPVVARDRAAITAFIKANPGLTQVTCVGSTSGIPIIDRDEALALARAKNACSVVESLVPGVKTRLVASTGKGVGQFYRAVILFGKGTKAN